MQIARVLRRKCAAPQLIRAKRRLVPLCAFASCARRAVKNRNETWKPELFHASVLAQVEKDTPISHEASRDGLRLQGPLFKNNAIGARRHWHEVPMKKRQRAVG